MNETTSGGFTSLFDAGAPPAVAPAPQPPTQQAAPAAATATQQAPPEQAQQPLAQAPVITAEDKEFMSLLTPEQPQVVEWNDDAKKVFKATYGAEDPIAFKQQFDTVSAEVTVLRQKNEQNEGSSRLLDRIEQQYPALAAAIAAAAENKDPFEVLSSMPNPSVLGRASKDLPEHFLLETYKSDRFPPEEIKALKTGDYSELSVTKEDMQAKVKHYLPLAQDMHDERNQKHVASFQQKEQVAKQQREAMDKSITEGLASANNDPAVRRHITPEFIEKFRKGSVLHGTIFNEDGTWSKSAPSILIKGSRYDVDIKRAYEAGLGVAQQRSIINETGQMASRSAPNSGASAPPQQQQRAPSNGTFTGIEDFMSPTAMPQRTN